jgi:hypothetical protein
MIEAGAATLTQEPTALPRGVPPGLAQVVGRALEKDPARRLPDGSALALALEQLGTTSSAHLDVARASLPKSLPRGAVLLAALVLGGGMVAAGLVVGKVSNKRRTQRTVRVEPPAYVLPVGPVAPVPPLPPAPPGAETQPEGPEGLAVPPPPPGTDGDPTAAWPKIVLQTRKGPRTVPVPPGFEPDAFAKLLGGAVRAEEEGRATKEQGRALKEQAKALQEQGRAEAAKPDEGLADPADLTRVQVLEITQTLARSGQLAQAERFVARAIEDEPDDQYYRVHRALVLRRQGRLDQSKAELLAVISGQDLANEDAEWPAPVLRFYAGQLDDAALIAFGRAHWGTSASRFCEIYYYLGMYYATQRPPDQGKAMSYLGQAASAPRGVRDIEKDLAQRELERR